MLNALTIFCASHLPGTGGYSHSFTWIHYWSSGRSRRRLAGKVRSSPVLLRRPRLENPSDVTMHEGCFWAFSCLDAVKALASNSKLYRQRAT
jgi:hypothetical protein